MPARRFLYAVAPDGTIVRRDTHREYSHAVLVFSRGSWGAYGFAGRLDLAHKTAGEAHKCGQYLPSEIAIVPVSDVKPEA